MVSMEKKEREYWRKYYQVCLLMDEQGPWRPRLAKIRTIIQQPDFKYRKEYGADMAVGCVMMASYWLDKELFDESYLYQKQKQNLSGYQFVHFELVDIGAFLLNKGFPVEYDASKYPDINGMPNPIAPWVSNFVKQCHKRYELFYRKISHNNLRKKNKDFSRTHQ